jgi:hypothetical protein
MFRNVLILCVVLLNFVYAQSSSDNTSQQFWLDYNPQLDLSESYTLYGSVGGRTIIPYTWTKVYFTGAVRYAPDPLFNIFNKSQQELHGGLSVFYTFNEDKDNQIELRPFQGYKIRWPHLERVKFTHFLRLEERFIFTTGESDFEFELRARYKIEAIFHRSRHLVDFANGFYFPISVEFLINLYSTQQFNDGIRITPGLGYSSDAEFWKVQFDLTYQYADKAEVGSFTKSTIIYRLRFFQAL